MYVIVTVAILAQALLERTMSSMPSKHYQHELVSGENGALGHESTGLATIDWNTKAVRSQTEKSLLKDFALALTEDGDVSLQMEAYIGDPRDGKGEKKLRLLMLMFLRNVKPKTYVTHLRRFVQDFGCLKDLSILALSLKDLNVNSFEIQLWKQIIEEAFQDGCTFIRLVAKWIPKESSKRFKKVARVLAKAFFPTSKDAMKLYRTEIVRKLTGGNLFETKLTDGRYAEIELDKLPAKTVLIWGRDNVVNPVWKQCKDAEKRKEMDKFHAGAFARHMSEKLNAFRAAAKDPNSKVKPKTTALEPHVIIRTLLRNVDETCELIFMEMIRKIASSPVIKKSLAVADVSGSMSGEPMEVAIAFSLLIACASDEDAFKDMILTFSERPEFHNAKGETIREKARSLSRANWGYTTNFEATFDLIMEMYHKYRIPYERQIEYLYVFTDMQWDQAQYSRGGNKETFIQTMKKKFKAQEFKSPKIVFWNLRATTGTGFPIDISTPDMVLVSGFSIELLKAFMSGTELHPKILLEKMLAPYKSLTLDATERGPVTDFDVEMYLKGTKVSDKEHSTMREALLDELDE